MRDDEDAGVSDLLEAVLDRLTGSTSRADLAAVDLVVEAIVYKPVRIATRLGPVQPGPGERLGVLRVGHVVLGPAVRAELRLATGGRGERDVGVGDPADAAADPALLARLAERTATHPRYAREWLEQQAVTGLLTVDEHGLFTLPPAAAEVLRRYAGLQA